MTAINLPSNWCNKSLRDLATINYGKSPKAILSEDGDIPVVGTGGVERYGSSFLYESESIILGRKGTIDKVSFVDGKFWAIDTTYFLSDFQDANVRWLFYFLQTIDFRLMNEATGVPSLSRDMLYKIQVPTPPVDEQTQIATILSTIDQAIERTAAIIAKQQWIKAGLMQNLLTKGIDEHGVIRSEATHEFKDSPLGRIPVEWEVENVGTAAYVTKLAGFEYTNHFNYGEGGDIIALRALNIKNEKLDLTDVQSIPKKVSDRLPRSKINSGDILITYIGAYIGDVVRISESDKYHLAPNIAKIVASKIILPEFLEIALRSQYLQRQIKNLTATTATPSLTMTQIRSLLLAIPRSKDEQLLIANQVSAISELIVELSNNLEKLRREKTGLMHDLLTGNVRVKYDCTNG